MASRQRFLLCRPQFYGVEYVINPWMEGNVGRINREQALQQWEEFHAALTAANAVELIEPVPGLPDMPFTANAGLVERDLFIPSRFRFPQRQPEVRYFTDWFRRHGYRVVELPSQSTFEGEGDALFQPGRPLLWAGYGVRTSLQVYRYLADLLDAELVPLRLVDERFYHLDTCFCPLPQDRLIYYPDAFDADSRAAIEAHIAPAQRYAVDSTDALHFACNAVVVGDSILTNFAGERLNERLAAWGYAVRVCRLTEFIRAGGAAKCLALQLAHDFGNTAHASLPASLRLSEGMFEAQGHLLDQGVLSRLLDAAEEHGGSVEVENFQPGFRHDQDSWARLRVVAPSPSRLEAIRRRLLDLGVRLATDDVDAHVATVTQPGVAPEGFYATTIFPTDVRVNGRWIRATGQRMDTVLLVGDTSGAPQVRCCLLRDLHSGDQIVCGAAGVRVHPPLPRVAGNADTFAFMGAAVSSERRVELAVTRVADEMHAIAARGGKIVVVGGPVVIHTGGGPHLASIIRSGYVSALLAGNGLATHDIEVALFGTSLGVDLEHGTPVAGGHQHHLRAINRIRACGGIAAAVRERMLRSGVMYECVRHDIPFALAGSIRDDGPLPETLMDLEAAQRAYAALIDGAEMILMLASMLHAIGVGNMTPAGVRLICVDISPAVVTKLADRGSLESTGIVTDVGLFLNLLDASLSGAGVRQPRQQSAPSWPHNVQP